MVTKRVDAASLEVLDVLREYLHDHPHAHIDVYRYNPVSIRIRVIDVDFAGENRFLEPREPRHLEVTKEAS